MKSSYTKCLEEIRQALNSGKSENDKLSKVCKLINQNLENYDWVGFYFMNHTTKKLHLGPYVGNPTDHTIIDFGKGICGQVALSGESYLTADVNSESNYIACSIHVKSEIVVPMYLGDKLIGQIDIDSHKTDRFKMEDDAFLKAVNQLIVEHCPDLEPYIKTLIS